MLALVDADIIPYELGHVFDEHVPIEKVLRAVDDKIDSIVSKAKCSDLKCFLTYSPNNFRIKRATVSPYKGTRTHEKPHYWKAIRGYIQHNYPTEIADGLEADDLLGCALRNNSDAVICSRDKDMDTITGWHYRWRCGELQPARRYYVSPFDGWYFYYYQMLAGDVADNIKGVIGIGKVKAIKALQDCSNKDELHATVKQVYIDVYGGGTNDPIYYEDINKNRYWRKPTEIMSEMADLLYIGVDRTYLRRFDEK